MYLSPNIGKIPVLYAVLCGLLRFFCEENHFFNILYGQIPFNCFKSRNFVAVTTNELINQVTITRNYEKNCHFSGLRGNSNYNIYNYGDSSHISLNISGNRFNGYDYDTSSHFSGSVKNKSVTVYDYEKSSYFNYNI